MQGLARKVMKVKTQDKIIISLVCTCVGFMAAVQFQSMREPTKRDTRDLWEIRSQLQVEQKKQQQLYEQIADAEQIISQYQQKSEQQQLITLKESIEELEKKAGLTEVTGSGVKITVQPIFEGTEIRQQYPAITPELLHRLINELNSFGATDIAIENERVINTTPIRYVNGETYVNNHALPPVPLDIYVLSPNPKRLLNYIQVSQSKDYFSIEKLNLIAELQEEITLPEYNGLVRLDMLNVNEAVETGDE
ncbi:DUF881 domain-containing protein [Aquibacillus albus]|uniref:Uncharacterized protein YlxW (UPF0749 family) n=1 Tax=Aquibacillus albus TaxID=1168171 RepID=A0ABS2N0Q9_9BACI|nr:DUF881 domain-containing protein [Aquibacillus albus]MBM7571738.1 uncharacterized protein YlxW (UPF0749 family) [Aquibacillus albus]